jgi:hypothetical protein
MIEEKTWDGKTPISEPGIYAGIDIEDYHNRIDLLDGPSVSKSSLVKCAPPDGHPKNFWAYWRFNKDAVPSPTSRAMNFGRAVHALMLGDEVFSEKFAVRPAELNGKKWNSNRNDCREWQEDADAKGLTTLTQDQIDQIVRMANDAQTYPLVKLGILQGRIERSMFARHPATGIWLRVRPDVFPTDSGMFADLKTTSSLDHSFLEQQNGQYGYYIAAAMTRMVCRLLDIPFESYTLLYSRSKDYGDTDHRDISPFDLERGERVINRCLHEIKKGLDTGHWPNHRECWGGPEIVNIKTWQADYIDAVLDRKEGEDEQS